MPTNWDGQRDLPHFNHVADLRPRSGDVVVHKTTDPLDEILSIPEAAQQLDLPERDVRAFLADGTLRGAKIGGRWVTSADAVAELADELDAEPEDEDDDEDEDEDLDDDDEDDCD